MERTRIDATELWTLLGSPGGAPPLSRCATVGSPSMAGQIVEEIRLSTHAGDFPGTVIRPDGPGPFPSILYCHAHGNRYDIGRRELLGGRPALQDPPYGPLLAARGYLVFCIDVAGFGERHAEGAESALAKKALWRGRTLLGDMLANLSAALDHLCDRPDVDRARIATFGISMGATHAYWLAALDKRIAAAAHLCVFSNIAVLIEAGQHDLHGIYMTVPGLLNRCDMGDVAALVAPRPQFVGVGATDPLTPAGALEPALATLRSAYAGAGAPDRLSVLVSPETGHVETKEMRDAVLTFLDRSIGQSEPGRISL